MAVVDAKRLAAQRAADFVMDGMKVGLGTGSTVYWTIFKIGQRVREGLRIKCFATSRETERIAKEAGITVFDVAQMDGLDLCIDGADEVDPNLSLIKGGGGALFREKVVATASDRMIVVADASKQVDVLGKFPLPVETVPFGTHLTRRRIEAMGCRAALRLSEEGEPLVTDNGNHILDCQFDRISDPFGLHSRLKAEVGVVETGLFVGIASMAIFSDGQRVWEERRG